MRTYRVERFEKAWAVFDDIGARVSARATFDVAMTTMELRNMEEVRRATERDRACMCCAETFLSEGVWNRLCPSCSASSRQMVA